MFCAVHTFTNINLQNTSKRVRTQNGETRERHIPTRFVVANNANTQSRFIATCSIICGQIKHIAVQLFDRNFNVPN